MRVVELRPRTVTLEEVEHLLSLGERPAGIVTRLGSTPEAVAKALYRCARPDLARQFERLRDRGHSCVDCGAPVADIRNPRCRRDGNRHRVKARTGQIAS